MSEKDKQKKKIEESGLIPKKYIDRASDDLSSYIKNKQESEKKEIIDSIEQRTLGSYDLSII